MLFEKPQSNLIHFLKFQYAAPFSAEIAAKDNEAVKILNDCCYEWINSVETVLKDVTTPKAATKADAAKTSEVKPEEKPEPESETETAHVDNDVHNEIQMWEERLRRLQGLEEQLKMNAIQRSLLILNAAGNIHAKTLTEYINQIHGLLEEAQVWTIMYFLASVGTDFSRARLNFLPWIFRTLLSQ